MKSIQQTELNNNQLKDVCQMILEQAAKMGADQAEVSISKNKGFSVGVHDGEAETVEYHRDKVVEIDVCVGQRTGSASLSDLNVESIKAAVAAACHIAKFTDEDKAAGLADKSDLAFNYPTLSLAYPWTLSVTEAIALACECEREALQFDKRIMSAEQVSITTTDGYHLYANSKGFVGDYSYTRYEISCI